MNKPPPHPQDIFLNTKVQTFTPTGRTQAPPGLLHRYQQARQFKCPAQGHTVQDGRSTGYNQQPLGYRTSGATVRLFTWLTLCVFRHQDGLLKVELSITTRKKGFWYPVSWSDTNRIMVVIQAGLSMSETAALLRFKHTTVYQIHRERAEKEEKCG